MGTGTAVSTGEQITATKMNLKLEVIVDADVSASAAIAWSKLAALTSAHILVGNGSNVAVDVAVSGDITLANTGAVAIASGAIVDADVNASAAIAFSKLAALASAHILVGNGSNVATDVAVSGDITLANTGAVAIASGVIVDADVNASAAIAASKILISGAITLADWRHASDAEKIDGGDIYGDSITTAALANEKSWMVIPAHKTTVDISQSDVEIFEYTIPANMSVASVQVYCTAVAATASVEVKEAGTTILASAITPSAGAVVTGTVSDAALASGAALTVHVTTNGTGTITDLSVTITCKVTHTT